MFFKCCRRYVCVKKAVLTASFEKIKHLHIRKELFSSYRTTTEHTPISHEPVMPPTECELPDGRKAGTQVDAQCTKRYIPHATKVIHIFPLIACIVKGKGFSDRGWGKAWWSLF